MIRFIIKSVFWLSLAFIIMPKIINSDADQTQRQDAAIPLPSQEKIDDVISAGQTAAQVGSFCYNNPDLCMQGKNIISATGSSLLNGSGKLLDFLSNQLSTENTTEAPVQTNTNQSSVEISDQPSSGAVPLPRHRPQ